MKYALVENNVVIRLLRVEPSTVFHQPEASRYEPCPDDVMEGWVRSGGALVAPSPVPAASSVPLSISKRQARRALHDFGMLESVESAINNIQDPDLRQRVRIDYEDAQEYERAWPTLLQLAALIGLTDAQLDELFIHAATL